MTLRQRAPLAVPAGASTSRMLRRCSISSARHRRELAPCGGLRDHAVGRAWQWCGWPPGRRAWGRRVRSRWATASSARRVHVPNVAHACGIHVRNRGRFRRDRALQRSHLSLQAQKPGSSTCRSVRCRPRGALLWRAGDARRRQRLATGAESAAALHDEDAAHIAERRDRRDPRALPPGQSTSKAKAEPPTHSRAREVRRQPGADAPTGSHAPDWPSTAERDRAWCITRGTPGAMASVLSIRDPLRTGSGELLDRAARGETITITRSRRACR